jgi:hypothetical protein
MKYSHDEKLEIRENAKRYDGSFAKTLIEAYIIADASNSIRIENAFPELLEKYLHFGQKPTTPIHEHNNI